MIKTLLKEDVLKYKKDLINLDSLIISNQPWDINNFLLDLPHKYKYSKIFLDNDKVVGFIIASVKDRGKCLYIHRLVVDSAYQRKGIGRELINSVITQAKLAPKIKFCALKVHHQNKEAMKFYENLSFKRIFFKDPYYYYIKSIRKLVVAIHQPEYIGWLGFYHKMLISDIYVILDNVGFQKGGFQNRNKIRNKNNSFWITIPVYTKKRLTQKINEVEIVKNIDWQKKHLLSIKYAYNKAVYFKDYFPFIEDIYTSKYFDKLIDINLTIIRFIKKILNIEKEEILASWLDVYGKKEKLLINIVDKVGGRIYLSGVGAKNYLREELFDEVNIKLKYQNFIHPVYKQLFSPFIPNLAIFDFLFNCNDIRLIVKPSGSIHLTSSMPNS